MKLCRRSDFSLCTQLQEFSKTKRWMKKEQCFVWSLPWLNCLVVALSLLNWNAYFWSDLTKQIFCRTWKVSLVILVIIQWSKSSQSTFSCFTTSLSVGYQYLKSLFFDRLQQCFLLVFFSTFKIKRMRTI